MKRKEAFPSSSAGRLETARGPKPPRKACVILPEAGGSQIGLEQGPMRLNRALLQISWLPAMSDGKVESTFPDIALRLLGRQRLLGHHRLGHVMMRHDV